jgi:hypothetical protein
VGLRAGLNTEARGESFAPAEDRTSNARSASQQPDTILPELPGSLLTQLIERYSCVYSVS